MNQLARIMRLQHSGVFPPFHDQVDARPKRHIPIGTLRQMSEQPHPKSGDRFVIDMNPVPRGELEQCRTHSDAGIGEWERSEIIERRRHVRRMIELRWGNRARFESVDQFVHFSIATEIARLHHSAISAITLKSRLAAPFRRSSDNRRVAD